MDKDYVDDKKAVEDNSFDERKSSDASKNIKKDMDRFEEKIKSGDAPAGDATRSEE
jgi:hypothetical protein